MHTQHATRRYKTPDKTFSRYFLNIVVRYVDGCAIYSQFVADKITHSTRAYAERIKYRMSIVHLKDYRGSFIVLLFSTFYCFDF